MTYNPPLNRICDRCEETTPIEGECWFCGLAKNDHSEVNRARRIKEIRDKYRFDDSSLQRKRDVKKKSHKVFENKDKVQHCLACKKNIPVDGRRPYCSKDCANENIYFYPVL